MQLSAMAFMDSANRALWEGKSAFHRSKLNMSDGDEEEETSVRFASFDYSIYQTADAGDATAFSLSGKEFPIAG